MRCRFCGRESPEGSAHCVFCGSRLDPGEKRKNSAFRRIVGLIAVLAVALAVVVGAMLTGPKQQTLSSGGGSVRTLQGETGQEETGNGPAEAEETEQVTYREPSDQLQDVFVKDTAEPLALKVLPRGDSETAAVIPDFYSRLDYYGEQARGRFTWYRVWTAEGVGGWVRSDRVVSLDENVKYPYPDGDSGWDAVKFTEDNLNVRKEPADSGQLICQIKDCGTYLHICTPEDSVVGLGSDNRSHDWYKAVIAPSCEGWVRGDLVAAVSGEDRPGKEGVYVKALEGPLPVKTQPKQDSALAAQIQKADTRMYYDGTARQGRGADGRMYDWYQVRISATQQGWVRSDQIRQIDP